MSKAFDPDAYLAAPVAPKATFDPDAYVAQPTAPRESADAPEAFFRGAGSGVTLGFNDEVNGGIQALIAKAMGDPRGLGALYSVNRNTFRREDEAAEAEHPTASLLGNVLGGSVVAPLLPGGQAKTLGQIMKTGAALGGVSALGSSTAELTPGRATPQSVGRAGLDMTVGLGVGAGASALGYGVQRVGEGIGGWMGGRAAARANAATARNAENAEAKALEEVLQGSQKSAAANADLNRQTERIRNGQEALAELGITFTPEQQAAIKAAEAKSAQKALERLPASVSESDAAAAALQEALANRSARAAEFTEQGANSTFGSDAWELFKAYGEPIAGASLGGMAGNALGGLGFAGAGSALGTFGGLLLGRTRAGKATHYRWNKPGNQLAIARAQALLGSLVRGSAPLAAGLEGATARSPGMLSATQGAALSLPQLAALFGQVPQRDQVQLVASGDE